MSATSAIAAAYMERPNQAPGTKIHPPEDGVGPWVLQRGPRYFRVGGDIAQLVGELDGHRDHDELAARLGGVWSAGRVGAALDRLDAWELVDRGDMVAPREASRFRLVPPLTLQVTVLRPGPTMLRLRPVFGLLAGRSVGLAAVLTALAGLVALAVQNAEVTRILGDPLPVSAYLAVLLGLIIGTSIHELGHAAALIHYGGRPSRIGVMIFYLMPSFFCDVSDSWRLPHRHQRVRVALAGPAVQTFLAGAAALAALLLPASDLRTSVLFFAIGSYGTGVLNLLPFVKLDGYIALMTAVDLPYLRQRAMTDARRTLARVFFGGHYEREFPHRWTTWYGFACLGFPFYLLATALTLWIGILQRAGLAGLLLVVGALLYALVLLVRGARRVAAEVAAGGVSRLRVTAVGALLTGGLAALMFVPMTASVSAAFVTRSGTTELILLEGPDTADIAPGQQVELQRNGAVLHSRIGSAEVADAPGQPGTGSVSSFFPVVMTGDVQVPVTRYRLTVQDQPAQADGIATVRTGRAPLWQVAYRTFVRPFR